MIAIRFAALCVQRRTRGDFRPRTAAESSSRPSRRTSESSSPKFSTDPFHPPSNRRLFMPFDYSQTKDPRDFSELIPHGTIATVQMRIHPGNAGPGGPYKRTSKGDAEMLDCEFV